MENKKIKEKRGAVYTRVSSDEQVKGYSLTFQEEEIKEMIKKDGFVWEKCNVFIDDGYSGASGNRPALKEMIKGAKEKKFDVIYVWKIDRLFRNTKLVLNLVDDFADCGVGIKSVLEPFCDSSNPLGRFMFTTLSAGSEMELANIRERTHHGRMRAVREGKWVMGACPFGYRLDKKTKKLRIVADEAKWVREFFKWLVDERLSLSQIMLRANELNIPTLLQRTKRKILGKKSLGIWHKRTLGRMLTNEAYTGVFYFHKYKKGVKSLTEIISKENIRPREDWIKIETPAIISPETFELAKKQLMRNREMSIRNAKRAYLFSKILYCGHCGYKMFGACSPPKKEHHKECKSYRGVFRRKEWLGGSKRCLNGCGIYAESRLEPVWEVLEKVLRNPNNIYSNFRKYGARRVNRGAIKERLEQIEKQLPAIAKKKTKLMDLYLDDDGMEQGMYKSRLGEYERNEKGLKEERIRLNQILLNKEERLERERALKKLSAKIKKKMDGITYEEKARVLHWFTKKVILFPKDNVADVLFEFPQKEYVSAFTPSFEPEYAISGECLWDKRGRHSPKMD